MDYYQQSVNRICETLVNFSTNSSAISVIGKFFTIVGSRYYFISKTIGKPVCIDTEDRKIYVLENTDQGDLDKFPEITWSELFLFWTEVTILLEKNTIELLKKILFQITSDFISWGIPSFLERSIYIKDGVLYWEIGDQYARIDPVSKTATLVSGTSVDPGSGKPLGFKELEEITVILERLLVESRVVSEEFIQKTLLASGQRAWFYRDFSLN